MILLALALAAAAALVGGRDPWLAGFLALAAAAAALRAVHAVRARRRPGRDIRTSCVRDDDEDD